MTSTSRRDFIERAALSSLGIAASLPDGLVHTRWASRRVPRTSFLELRRSPDLVIVQTESDNRELKHTATGRWTGDDDIVVDTAPRPDSLHVALSAPATGVKRLYIRWRGELGDARLVVGDAWERAYGDLEWRGWVPDRVMPWYFAMSDGSDGSLTHAYGVRTGARAFCYWQVDPHGISLCADVRSGSVALRLGERTLDVCDVICREGCEGESAFAALHAFCGQMCAEPRLPSQPVYGSNDWYWAYGDNSAATVRVDAQHILELSPSGANRPFVVIDDGWQPGRGRKKEGAGRWDTSNEKFPDLPGLATELRREGARPGIWIRPLQAPADARDGWRLRRDRDVLDPTVPEVLEKVSADVARLREWGFELVKHDYTTYDIFGRWGFRMGTALTDDGWSFASGADRTTAEVIDHLYATIRAAAGETLIIGCNTVSHLSAGHFELCRVGDDTSGTEWARTRKMGVNSLAFRGDQHGAFYVADADCAAVTNAVPWSLEAQWLDLLARSGTTLFVSLAPDALGAAQRHDLRAALALAAGRQPLAEPLDWQSTVYPRRWRLMGEERSFEWVGADGTGLP